MVDQSIFWVLHVLHISCIFSRSIVASVDIGAMTLQDIDTKLNSTWPITRKLEWTILPYETCFTKYVVTITAVNI